MAEKRPWNLIRVMPAEGSVGRDGEIILNGTCKRCPTPIPLPKLLDELKLNRSDLAVSVNDAVIPRSRRGDTLIEAGDRVEILCAVAGG